MNKVLVMLIGVSSVFSFCAKEAGVGHSSEKYNLKIGQKVTITLPSNPSTGYSWHVRNDETDNVSKMESNRASIMKYRSKYIAPQNTTPRLVGVPGQEELTFIADRPGSALIKIEYLRIWDPGSVDQSRVLEFNVQ